MTETNESADYNWKILIEFDIKVIYIIEKCQICYHSNQVEVTTINHLHARDANVPRCHHFCIKVLLS